MHSSANPIYTADDIEGGANAAQHPLEDQDGVMLEVRHECTVRRGISINSRQVRTIQPGETVKALEKSKSEGHLRVRIGENEWASMITAQDKVLLESPDGEDNLAIRRKLTSGESF